MPAARAESLRGRLDAARAVFAEVAEPLLARLPQSDAALERARLFGSALSVGIVDTILLDGSRAAGHRFGNAGSSIASTAKFSLGGRRLAGEVPLRGVADRIDLLEGNRLRVVDYKTGSAPERTRALQVPVYALCAQERLAARDGGAHGRSMRRSMCRLPARKPSSEWPTHGDPKLLATARERVFGLVDQINAGEFPPRPHDPIMCGYCAYSSVCRKDYVE